MMDPRRRTSSAESLARSTIALFLTLLKIPPHLTAEGFEHPYKQADSGRRDTTNITVVDLVDAG